VAPHDDVGTAVAVDVADVDAFGDLPEDALVDVMADELERGRPRRPDGSRREAGEDHRGAKEPHPHPPRAGPGGAGLPWRPVGRPERHAAPAAFSRGARWSPRALHTPGGA